MIAAACSPIGWCIFGFESRKAEHVVSCSEITTGYGSLAGSTDFDRCSRLDGDRFVVVVYRIVFATANQRSEGHCYKRQAPQLLAASASARNGIQIFDILVIP